MGCDWGGEDERGKRPFRQCRQDNLVVDLAIPLQYSAHLFPQTH
jgi:hypothetical protein